MQFVSNHVFSDQVYGFPEYRVPGFKIGRFHHRYQILQSGDKLYQNPIDENDEQVLRECLEDFFPEANGPVMSMNACMFSLSPDEHFIIDFLPNYDNQVVIAAGFSGHGFKFVGVVGEVLSQLLTEGKSNLDIDFFRVGRVLKSEK
jgi:sarcosine oxidase